MLVDGTGDIGSKPTYNWNTHTHMHQSPSLQFNF